MSCRIYGLFGEFLAISEKTPPFSYFLQNTFVSDIPSLVSSYYIHYSSSAASVILLLFCCCIDLMLVVRWWCCCWLLEYIIIDDDLSTKVQFHPNFLLFTHFQLHGQFAALSVWPCRPTTSLYPQCALWLAVAAACDARPPLSFCVWTSIIELAYVLPPWLCDPVDWMLPSACYVRSYWLSLLLPTPPTIAVLEQISCFDIQFQAGLLLE